MNLHQPQVFGVLFCLLPFFPKDGRRLGFDGIRIVGQDVSAPRAALAALVNGDGPIVLLAAFVVCVPPRPSHSHLQELPRHVRANKIALSNVRFKKGVNLCGRFTGDFGRLEAPEGQYLAFVIRQEINGLTVKGRP